MSKSKTIGSTILGVLSSILAFLGVVSCCGLPILAGVLATLGIGASQLEFFAKYRYLFIGLAIASLLFGFYQLYFKKSNNCCESQSSCCGQDDNTNTKKASKSKLVQKIFLWAGTIIVVAMLVWGNNESKSEPPTTPQSEKTEKTPVCCPE